MKIDINDVVDGSNYRGKILFVCDYRKELINKKAIRHVKPTKIIVLTSEDFINAGKDYPTVYYSNVAFVTLNKKDEPVYSKVISPFDNTGYRSFSGIGLMIFDNLDECIEEYNNQVQTVLDMYEREIRDCTKRLMQEHSEISNLIIKDKK